MVSAPTESATRSLVDVLTRSGTEHELLAELAATVRNLSGADACDVMFRDRDDGLVLRASTEHPELNNRLRLGKGIGLFGDALLEVRSVFVPEDVRHHPRYARYPGVEDADCVAMAVLPLQGADDRAMGVLVLRKSCRWELAAAEQGRLDEMAAVVSCCVRGFRKAYQAGTQSNRLGALSEVSKTIASSPYVEEILQLLVNLTAQQFNYRVCTVRLLDENRGELVLRATQAPAKAYQRKRAIKLGESIAGRAIAENRPVIVRDVQVEADYIGHDLAVEQGLRSMICTPLTLQDKPIGVLSCYTGEVRDFPADEIKALETLAKQAAFSIEYAKLQVRNTLMQEMHHRVKNNLQQVASLLRLQLSHGEYKSLEEAINDILGRILAIASVHDLLSREDLDHVGIRSIAESLVHHQQSSLVHPGRHIRFQVQGDDVHLNMSQATQLALVLNELIQNAVEHGFAQADRGEIHVNVEEKEGEISVWVSNSGDPLPPDFDPSVASHLGLKIVDSLGRALGGKFSIQEINGWTVAEVTFQRQSGE